jgi:hypothetical protein
MIEYPDYTQDGNMIKIFYCSKDQLYPRFGCAFPSKQVAYVRDDLPGCVKRFVAAHELYHLGDKAMWWVWREIKANMAGAFKHPIGFALCSLMSVVPYRLWYYWIRITGKAE